MTARRSSDPLLLIPGLTRAFGGLIAVDDIEVEISAGEAVGLIGPNGAGKTTLFNGVSGFDRRKDDRVRFDGEDVSKLRPHDRARRGLIRTFQGVRTFPSLSVEQHLWIAEHALPGRSETAWSLASGLADEMGLSDYDSLPAEDLPYGLMKALGIVMCVSAGAKLLMLDEPVAGLNEEEAQRVEMLLRRVLETQVAVWIIDHHVEFLEGLVDRLMVMDYGQKIADGPVSEVMQDPAVHDAYLGT